MNLKRLINDSCKKERIADMGARYRNSQNDIDALSKELNSLVESGTFTITPASAQTNNTFIIDVQGNVVIRSARGSIFKTLQDSRRMNIAFNRIQGNFTITESILNTLEGFPLEIEGDFNVENCKRGAGLQDDDIYDNCPDVVHGTVRCLNQNIFTESILNTNCDYDQNKATIDVKRNIYIH